MSQSWHSLYIRTSSAQPVIDALRATLVAHDYTPYDPFPGGTGTPPRLNAMVRQFVAPPADGWVRVLGAPDAALLPELQQRVESPLLYGWLTESGGGFAMLDGSQQHTDPAAFADFLQPDATLDDLRAAFEGAVDVRAVKADEPPMVVLGAEALPPELQAFAQQQGVDVEKADSLVERLGGKLLGRFTGGDTDAEKQQAYEMLAQSGGPNLWNSEHGQRVRAIAGVLDLPDNWQTPTWQQVRDAYQVFRLRRRSPRMMLMPGDKEAMAAVPDALDYTPVYMGTQQQ